MKVRKLHSRLLQKRALLIAAILLMALSYLFSYYFLTTTSISAERNSLQLYIHQQQEDFKSLLSDSALMRQLVQQNESLRDFEKLDAKPYGIFLYAETLGSTPQFLFWNDHKILPIGPDFSLEDGEYFRLLENGYYVIEKRTVQLPGISSNVIAYAMVPVLSQYEIKTSYLSDHFAHNSNAHKKIAISENKNGFPVKSLHGIDLFYVQKAKGTTPVNNTIIIMLQLAALVLILAYIHFASVSVIEKKGTLAGLALLFGVLLLMRLAFYFFPSFFYFLETALFDPKIYSANVINRSLGDLFINATFFCWVAVFTWFSIGTHKPLPAFLSGKKLQLAGVLCLFFLIWGTFQLADVVRSMVAKSAISFNVNDFFSLDAFTVVGFVVLALLSLGFYYFSRLLFRVIFPAFVHPVYVYILLPLAGLLYLTLQPGNEGVTFDLLVLGWLILYSLIIGREQLVINRFRINIAGVLFWIIIFSASLAAIILQENRNKEWNQRMEYARNLDQDTSPIIENDLSIGTRYLDNRFLANNFARFSNPDLQKPLRDSIIRSSISPSYVNSFNVQLYLFNSKGNGMYNRDSISFFELNDIYTSRSKPTENADIYLHEKSKGEYAYITKRTITDSSGLLGTLFIISTPKRFTSQGFSYELLSQIDRKKVEYTQIYAHAIYRGRNLLTTSRRYFPFPTLLQPSEVPRGELLRQSDGEYDKMYFNAGPDIIKKGDKNAEDKIIVVVKKQNTIIESITLFSYLFCSFLLMIILLKVISILLKSGNNWRELQSFWQLNIRSQIQGIVIFISVISFIIIGVVTISFFIERYNRNNLEELLRISGVMLSEIETNLPVTPSDTTVETDNAEVDLYYRMEDQVNTLAAQYNVDVNVYDLSGNMQVSSTPEIYNEGVLSTKMHPLAYYHLNRLQEVQRVQQENMSSLKFLSIYRAVRDSSGKTRSYFNIPFYSSQFELEQEISNFLIAIINLNAFVFLIAGTIAVIITNKITRSFSIIGDKMKAITLGRTNEEIEWKRNDEIGELVKQYNKMVRQLEQSAEALAKSEREGAWREMARQVAHEIKNPLTPMKLSIQYLQKAITNGHANVKELTTNVASTLIEQIDHLSKIAADFGRFANIGNRNLELFDLHAVIESLKDLYSSNPNVQLRWKCERRAVMVEADRTHMNRLFTNLLTNAIDACNEESLCQIEIVEEVKENVILIQIKDNGEGIPKDIQPKIFMPNFTTKTSGTGLGLAICKSIVEQAGGDIWFETELGKGTSFYVTLPLADTF